MMKEIQENELNFVARHFRDGLFSPRRGWRRFRRTRRVRTFAWGYAALAGAFAALVLGIFLFERNAWTTVGSAATARTVVLPDRTQATLAPGATLAFYRHGFGRRNRSVRMAGKVYFAVAHQEELPFEITAAEGFVRVLGTRFQVETDSTGTRVDVVDGRVLFAHVPDGRRQGRSARKGVPVREQDGLVLTRGMHAELPPAPRSLPWSRPRPPTRPPGPRTCSATRTPRSPKSCRNSPPSSGRLIARTSPTGASPANSKALRPMRS